MYWKDVLMIYAVKMWIPHLFLHLCIPENHSLAEEHLAKFSQLNSIIRTEIYIEKSGLPTYLEW